MLQLEGCDRYIESALRLLQFVEDRRTTGRRFGADADARWSSFRGDLETIDRIELMIRDADAEWRGAFGARTIYAIEGVPEDEPFGSRWPSLDPVDAEELWRRVKTIAAPTSPKATLEAIANVWGLKLAKHSIDDVAPTDQLVVVGPSAIVATIIAFAEGTALDWPEQVTVVASAPVARQLAAAGAAILNAKETAPIVRPGDKGVKKHKGSKLVASADADMRDLEMAEQLVGG